jgi:F-type H+-transporting ATPase subunit c
MLAVVLGTIVFATPAFAADGGGIVFSASFGAGLTIVGAGLGFAKIGGSALESIARQPEAAGDIRGAMIVIAALLEGATFFALIVCVAKGVG